jgi:hypothetical protein
VSLPHGEPPPHGESPPQQSEPRSQSGCLPDSVRTSAGRLRNFGRDSFLPLTTAVVTAALLLWAYRLAAGPGTHGLSPIFFYLFTESDADGLKATLAIVAVAALLSALADRGSQANALPATTQIGARQPRFAALLSWIGSHPLWIAAGSAVLLSWGAWSVYLHWPLCMDEYAPLFQSKIFASGHVEGHFPPQLLDWLIPRGFQDYFLNVRPATGAVTSAYWPSFALLLTPFTWLGVPWICNPLISAATLLATHRLALRIFGDREAAGLAVLLTLASPEFLADGISYYSMSAHMLANALYALLLVPATGAAPRHATAAEGSVPTAGKALVAGIIGSVALTLHNPVPHILFALPWIIWLLCRPGGLRVTLYLFAGYLPLCLLLGLGWVLSTFPHGDSVATFTAPFALPNATVGLMRLVGIAKIWAWSVPGLLLLAIVGAWRWWDNIGCRLLASSAVLTLVGYFFVPVDQGHGWGYRYFHSAWIALPILAVAALQRVPPRAIGSRTAATRFIVTCALLSLFAGTALRAVQIHGFIARHLHQIPAYAGTEHRVVILDTQHTFYGRDLIQNDPFLREDVITLITHAPQADAAMMKAQFPAMHEVYADRFGTVWSGDTKVPLF